ncbi:DUF6483 family protein [Paenibacillus chartarius]|uniref:DUF6483 family protein n=1 Tax=Paenibacillus chartarius TaxID=747481 RepID=A0ABV6DF73_9BACL
MQHRDYITRLIEEMSKMMATVLSLQRQDKKHQEAFDLLEGLFSRLYLPKSKVLVHLSESDLLALFRTNDIIETDKMAAASLLLTEEAEVSRDWGREEDAYLRYATALFLRAEAALHEEQDNAAPAHAEEIEKLLRALDHYHLPLHVIAKLAAYYEAAGQYDQAENMLYRLLKAAVPGDRHAEFRQLAHDFYERLLKMEDTELSAGGLPRDEVLEGLHALM